KALPSPVQTARTCTAPRNAIESQLAAIWQEVLGLDNIGVEDNFFELGGDSIVSLQVVSRARQVGWALSPKDIFSHQTVAALAGLAARLALVSDEVSGTAVIADRDLPLTPIQAEFIASRIPERQHWNQSVLLQTEQALDTRVLAKALPHLVEHHDALRLRFLRSEGHWRQYYAEVSESEEILWLRQANDAEQISEIAQQAQRSLDLQHGPLLRAVYMEVADGSYRLLLVVHHLVVDGVSWRILLEDLQTLYRQMANAQTPQLPAKTAAFQAWAEALQHRAAQVSDQLDYWRQQLTAVNCLPVDFAVGNATAADAETVTLQLDPASTTRLLQEASAAYRTRIDDLLLTALARVLCRWSGHAELSVDLEGHGREAFTDAPDVSRSVGWFTSAYPLKLMPAADLAASIKTIKEQVRRIPERGLGYGLLKYLADDAIRAELQGLPKPLVCFNYLGQFDASFADTGLFRAAGEVRGDERDSAAPLDYALEINSQIYDGQLAMNWTYNRQQFHTASIERLAAEFNAELALLIGHCSHGPQGVTTSDFPLADLTQAQLETLPVDVSNLQDIYPLTPMQQGMLFHSLYEGNAASYVSCFDVRLDGLDAGRFEGAWQAVLDRHPVLRTGFLSLGDWPRPLQVVHKRVTLPLQVYDWRGRDDAAPALQALIAELHTQGVQTEVPPLFKLVLVRLNDASYHLIWLSHHLLLDGWSSARLLGEVLAHYRGVALPAPIAEFRDYIAWLQSLDAQAAERYWRQPLSQLEAPTRLAEALSDGAKASGHGFLPLVIDGDDFLRLRQAAQADKLTVNTLIQGTWTLLLQRYTGNQSVAFGVTVSGRPTELVGVEDMIGLFINTLPIIQAPRADSRVRNWLQGLQQDNLNLREHEATPLADIQRWWGRAGEALFDSLLVFENYPLSEALKQRADDGLLISGGEHSETTNYPLTLAVQSGEALQIVFDYDRQFFSDEAVANLAEHFGVLLNHLITQPDSCIGELQWLTKAEQTQFELWNVWAKTYDEATPVHQLIQCRAAQQPDAVALVCGGRQLSYA
ncbi:MAG: condensation domain-containing protein, partial [Aquabacterium sp.]|uniref:condensation domain-containing protein n=1 Tax=Aquabacterium sp. TaxID=1872578 RepID=UPI002715EBC7